MARLADNQAERLAGALLAGDAVKGDAVKGDAPFTLISRRKVRFWIGASATLAAIILISWKVESHDPQSAGLSLGALSPIQEKDMKFTQAMSVAVAAGSICSGVMAQSTAVQWTTASGGNGHWYAIRSPDVSWAAKRQEAEGLGGHLATIRSNAEMQFVLERPEFAANMSAWIGFYRDGGYGAPWRWVTDEPFDFTPWATSQPCPCNGSCNCATEWAGLLIKQTQIWGTGFADGESPPCCGGPNAVFEWSADCNSDGIVDYGQILSGELIDTNSNGIPDICEIDPCPGDINLNSTVDAVDLAMVLTSWGTSGSEYPRADVNHDGVVNGPDLGALLGGWGICP